MTQPCEQEHRIEHLVKESEKAEIHARTMLKNQETLAAQHMMLVSKLDSFFDRLETILLADMERRTQIDQVTKDIDQLFRDSRTTDEEIERIKRHNAECAGAKIQDNFPKVWNWYQQEMGWRRFVPAAMTILTGLLALYVTFSEIKDNGHPTINLKDSEHYFIGTED